MAKDLHQLLRERDRRRNEEEAAELAAAASLADGGGGTPPSGGGGGGDDDHGRPGGGGSARDEPLRTSLTRPVVLAAMFFTFALGLFVGHSQNDVSAEEALPSDAPDASVAELRRLDATTRSAVNGAPPTLGAALADPSNAYTIQLASYSDRVGARAVADEHVVHLEGLGYRVVGPLRVGKSGHLVVLVEAAPTARELEDLCARLRELPSPRGSKPRFPDAFVRAIDDLITR